MIYITTHKDFYLPEYVYENHYDDIMIIDGGECKCEYPLRIMHETPENNDIYYLHNLYGELTRQYYIYINQICKDDIIGFMQYRRYFKKTKRCT